jgi:hypothetical protein
VVVGAWFVAPSQLPWAVVLSGLIFVRHSDNIRRLQAHTELGLLSGQAGLEQPGEAGLRSIRTPTPRE